MAGVSEVSEKRRTVVAIILAGGYGKRLWPITRDIAKPLLPVAGKPLINYLMEKIMFMGDAIGEVWILTNERFKKQFEKWAEGYPSLTIRVISDGSSYESEKPGAIGALAKVAHLIDGDFLVIAGDCIYEDDLDGFLDFFINVGKPVVAVYHAVEVDQVKRGSAVTLDAHGRITSFVEKPENPLTRLVGAVIYAFPSKVKDRLIEYVGLGLPRDEPGRFIEWLHRVEEVYGYVLKGNVWDIGTPKAYLKAEEIVSKRAR